MSELEGWDYNPKKNYEKNIRDNEKWTAINFCELLGYNMCVRAFFMHVYAYVCMYE